MRRTRRHQPTAPAAPPACSALPLSLASPAMLGANDAPGPCTSIALRAAARWCTSTTGPGPSKVPVHEAIAAALADPSPAALGALGSALVRWCERAAAGAYDPDRIGPSILAACDAAAVAFRARVDLEHGAPVSELAPAG